jgi:hypothetical protein
MTFSPLAIFHRADKYDGVRPINIYLLRLLYILMFFVLGKQTWTHILTHKGPWEPFDAVVWCVWAAFATLAGLGIIRPLKMLPIILLEIFYKVLWLLEEHSQDQRQKGSRQHSCGSSCRSLPCRGDTRS